jgi:DNA-binding GntR family transcriptional regulator
LIYQPLSIKLADKEGMMTIADYAYNYIKDRIISQEFPPASPVDTKQLMERLEVGKTPLREALQRLSFERLIVISPRRGTFVSDISIIQLQQAFDARLLVERYTARVAATTMTEEQIAALRDLFKDTDEIASRGDYMESISVDQRFHYLIAEATHNEYLRDFLSMLLPVTMRFWHYVHGLAKDSSNKIREAHQRHFPVIDALASGDPDVAERAMANHIVTFRDEAMELIMSGRKVG